MFWRIFTHHTLKGLLHAVQLVVFVVLPAALLWLHFRGLPERLHAPLVEAAEREGLDLEFTRMRLSFLQGIVLDNVRLRTLRLPDNPEVEVNRAAIGLDWRRLLQGRVELTSLDLRGAQLSLPASTEDGMTRSLRLTDARARLLLSDGVVGIPLARFKVQGIEVTASGQIVLGGEDPEEPRGAMLPPEVDRVLEWLDAIDFGKTPPRLDVEFAARSGDAGALQLPRLRFEAPEASYGGATLANIVLDASFADDVLELERLMARDEDGGLLDLSGRWNFREGSGQAEVVSSLDPSPWLAEWRPDGPWRDLKLGQAPAIQASIEIGRQDGPRVRVLGTMDTGKFSFRGVDFGGVSGGFAWRQGEFYASDVLLLPDDNEGTIRADFMMREDGMRLRVDSDTDPTPITALLPPKALETVEKIGLSFVEPPHIRFEAEGPGPDIGLWSLQGRVRLGRSAINGAPFDRATADVSFAERALAFSNMEVFRPEGSGSGTLTFDFERHQARLDSIRATLWPVDVLQWAAPKIAIHAEPYRFKAPPETTASGVIGLRDPSSTRLSVTFVAPRGLDYDLLGRTLNFGTANGTLRFSGPRLNLDVPSAQLYGGRTTVRGKFTLDPPTARQELNVTLENVDFETLTRLYFGYEGSKGVIDARYDFSFVNDAPRLMRGEGDLKVEDGNVFAIPVLGPLSLLLDTVIPGAGYQTARQATCDFTVRDGIIRTDNLNIIGQGFTMIGQGRLNFLEDRMNFTMRVNAQGVPGLILYPMSKLLEYISDGKLSEPKWRMRRIPVIPGTGERRDRDTPEP